jgi:hypothetical protein
VFYYFFATIDSEVIVRNNAKPIDSLEDLMNNQGIRPVLFTGTVTEEWFINDKKYLKIFCENLCPSKDLKCIRMKLLFRRSKIKLQ